MVCLSVGFKQLLVVQQINLLTPFSLFCANFPTRSVAEANLFSSLVLKAAVVNCSLLLLLKIDFKHKFTPSLTYLEPKM